jgi:NAD+ synthase
MPLLLSNPTVAIDESVAFIRQVFSRAGLSTGVIAVSGGIDSAVSLTLLTKALGKERVRPVLLPFETQDMSDALAVCQQQGIVASQVIQINIAALVAAAKDLGLGEQDSMRVGNLKARARMICLFDLAKKYDGLVCGTENKTEHYLGYFTRFGDAASDLEPISGWYKTQVRQVAKELGIPQQIIAKAPSAGLWPGQTDEAELGFSYETADAVLDALETTGLLAPLTNTPKPAPQILQQAQKIAVANVSPDEVQRVVERVISTAYKLQVPYTYAS